MTGPRCGGCLSFEATPAAIERALPGLASLSSAHAATRDRDGWCRLHDRLVRAAGHCARFGTRIPDERRPIATISSSSELQTLDPLTARLANRYSGGLPTAMTTI